jgi:gliding motility-associated-like protein
MPTKQILIFILLYVFINSVNGQTFYAYGNGFLNKIEIDLLGCADLCTITDAVPSMLYSDGTNFCPNGNLYGMNDSEIYQINLLTGNATLIFQDALNINGEGLVCSQDSLFYTVKSLNEELYEFNINTDQTTFLGNTLYDVDEEITFFEGQYYYNTPTSILSLDLTNPSNNVEMISWNAADYFMAGITGSSICNTLIGLDVRDEDEIVAINLAEKSITHVCFVPDNWHNIDTYAEFLSPVCQVYLDLDCDDSSGASNADYNASPFDCLSGPVWISDEDIKILIDNVITVMTVQLIPPTPDNTSEILVMTGNVPGINVAGLGSGSVTLTNAGDAKMEDFKQALRLLQYDNTSANPTPGLRTVEVQFFTASGSQSNIASAFINVIEVLPLQVDLGPDLEICDGDNATFDAGISGAEYDWSTNETTQTITASSPGLYSVTVSDGVHCPGTDTASLIVLAGIQVSLIGDTETCDNQPATLYITTNSPFPVDVEIAVSTGQSLLFEDVSGILSIMVSPDLNTVYEIISVTSELGLCVDLIDSIQLVEVHPAYQTDIPVELCDGDSIFISNDWEYDAGEYIVSLLTQQGCDSLIHYLVEILPAEQIFIQSQTCLQAEAGVFITVLENPDGCDTIVENTIVFVPIETTDIFLSSCVLANTGITTQTFTSASGCDSLVITTTTYDPPADTTTVTLTTCDSSLLGTMQQIFPAHDGCDSVVTITILLAPTDTTYSMMVSCDTSLWGAMHTTLEGNDGCDSIVIHTVIPGTPDTSYIYSTSCDSSNIGVFEAHHTSFSGCDSIVFSTVTFSAQDSTFLFDASCHPADTGVFISQYINQLGCDSIVTLMVHLLAPDTVLINSTNCDPASVGVFQYLFTNHLGCDSIVTETVTLLPSDETFLFDLTCVSGEAGTFINNYTNQFGCDSIVTLTVAYELTDTTLLNSQTCDPSNVGTVELLYTTQEGCDSLVIDSTTLFTPSVLQVESDHDYYGYDISCFDGNDGSASAMIDGTSPYAYIWSTGSMDDQITGLSAGAYSVSVTDGNGCVFVDEIVLDAPDLLIAGFTISELDCFENRVGMIQVEAMGGVSPYQFAIGDSPFQDSPVFNELEEGAYIFTIQDANKCEVQEVIWINVPLLVNVELGDDQFIENGDSAHIKAVINIPLDSIAGIFWSPIIDQNCPQCLDQVVTPLITTSYGISVISIDGCSDEDFMTVHLNSAAEEFYVPNIFSPNGDGQNDLLLISTGRNIVEISTFEIFDRWGNIVFSIDNLATNDPSVSWDGTRHGTPLNSSVFAYRMVVTFTSGRQEAYFGDVTLIR